MTFGGYKFAGYCLPYDSNVTGVARALAIHKTRLKAFTEAARLSESAWIFDPDKRTGTLAFENTQNAIHELTDENQVVRGYASFFKYNGQKTGYYLVLTVQKYTIDYGGLSGGIVISNSQCLTEYDSYYTKGPIGASCLHAISEEPFGTLPQNGIASGDLIPTRSTRLMSIGMNVFSSSSSDLQNIESGYVNPDSDGLDYCVFGYAMRGADFHQLNRVGRSFYDSSSIIQSLSLDAFSHYYNQNDTHGLFAMSLSGYGSSYIEYGISYPTINIDGQILAESGSPLCSYNISDNSDNNNGLSLAPDVRSCYCPTAGGNLVISGAIIALVYGSGHRVFDSGQTAKGCTNPEFIAINCTSPTNTQNYYTSYAGELLFISTYNVVPYCIFNGRYSNNSPSGSTNIYIGWDASNPDIRTEAAWPIYTP